MKKKKEVPEGERTFQRLQGQVAQLIATTPAGERLPAEPELAQSLGVSRATLREAMRSFEAQGLIRRRQGIGTFVVAHSQVIDSGLEVLESIETIARRIQLDVSMGELSVDTLAADAQQAEALGVPEGSQLVRVARVIHAENRPVAFLVDVLPADVLSPEDLKDGFTGSVLDWILRQGAVHLTNSYAEIQAVAASPEIARKLEIQRGDVLLLFTARLYSELNKVVDYSQSYFLPGYFRFHVVRRVGTGSI
jgi:GntR family transcriptional regulator